jgi:hypothetical protein
LKTQHLAASGDFQELQAQNNAKEREIAGLDLEPIKQINADLLEQLQCCIKDERKKNDIQQEKMIQLVLDLPSPVFHIPAITQLCLVQTGLKCDLDTKLSELQAAISLKHATSDELKEA